MTHPKIWVIKPVENEWAYISPINYIMDINVCWNLMPPLRLRQSLASLQLPQIPSVRQADFLLPVILRVFVQLLYHIWTRDSEGRFGNQRVLFKFQLQHFPTMWAWRNNNFLKPRVIIIWKMKNGENNESCISQADSQAYQLLTHWIVLPEGLCHSGYPGPLYTSYNGN